MKTEAELRKPTWQEGQWLTLADGGQWCFPPHSLRFFPQIADGKIQVNTRATFGPEHDPQLETLWRDIETEEGDLITARMTLAAGLLMDNYDLDNHALSVLLSEDPTSVESQQMWVEITKVLLGVHVKKPSAGGSDAASSPMESPAPSS